MAHQAAAHGSAPSRVCLLCQLVPISVEHCHAATALSNPDVQIASAPDYFPLHLVLSVSLSSAWELCRKRVRAHTSSRSFEGFGYLTRTSICISICVKNN